MRLFTLCDEPILLKRCESMNCDLDVITRKAADLQGNITSLVTRLYQSSVTSYSFTRCNVNGALIEISKHLKEVFDRGARSLPQGVREAVRAAAESTRSLPAGASCAVNKSMGLTWDVP